MRLNEHEIQIAAIFMVRIGVSKNVSVFEIDKSMTTCVGFTLEAKLVSSMQLNWKA